jgi:hypothetical protein
MDVEKGGVEKGEMGCLCTGHSSQEVWRNISNINGSISLFRRYEKVKKLIRARFLTAIFALVMAFAFTAGIGATAFAATPGFVGVADFVTWGSVRPNTYDSNFGVGDYFELQIVKMIENASGDVYPGFFSDATEADPGNFTWTQTSSTTGDSYIDLSTAEARETAPGQWVYYVVAYGGLAGTIGPESWELTYSYDGDDGDGGFTFVTTDFTYIAQDSGTEDNIGIEFYYVDPMVPTDLITSGDFDTISGGDDRATAPAYGRSYATPLDAVAHGTIYPGNIIRTYGKAAGQQMLASITDLAGNTYTGSGSGSKATGWLYAVYYTDDGHNYTRDLDSQYIGADDYKFKEDRSEEYSALVVWGIGEFDKDYSNYFPNTIYR